MLETQDARPPKWEAEPSHSGHGRPVWESQGKIPHSFHWFILAPQRIPSEYYRNVKVTQAYWVPEFGVCSFTGCSKCPNLSQGWIHQGQARGGLRTHSFWVVRAAFIL